MATMQINEFTSWNLTAYEFKIGSILNELNVQVIQNEISRLASEKLNLLYDTTNPMKYLQREAEITGQIGILQYLLAQSEAALNEVKLNLDKDGE